MRTRTIVLAGLAGLLTLAAVVVVVLGRVWLHDQHAGDRRDRAVTSAASTAVTAVLSYDYRSLRTNIDAASPLLTGDAKEQFQAASGELLGTAPKIHAITRATVKTSTVLSSNQSSAEVLLFVDQLSSSTNLTAPRVDQSRVVLTLVHRGGRWLVSELNAV